MAARRLTGGVRGAAVLFLLSFACTGSTEDAEVVNATVGATVQLQLSYSGEATGYTWTKGDERVAEWDFPLSVTYYDALKGRCDLNTSSGALTIRGLQQGDADSYRGEALVGNRYIVSNFHLHVFPEDALVTPAPCHDFQSTSFFSGANLNVQFLLFTTKNPKCGLLVNANTTNDVYIPNFNATLGTKILIHGFRVLGTKPSWIDDLTEALLRATDVNVVVVDWVSGSTAQYNSAVENMTSLGLQVTAFIRRLLALGASESSIHIIGVSLGAHVGGLVGHFFGGKLGRITGLDPAAYKFTKASTEERLDPGDALFVEAIHTDADNFGIRIPVGHIDYYINGGKDQPGCPPPRKFYSYLICDHMRAVSIYTSSLESACPLVGFPCSSYKNFTSGECLDCSGDLLQTCPRIGLTDRGGVPVGELRGQAQVFLMTSTTAPYCVFHSVVEIELHSPRSTSTIIEVSFIGENSRSAIQVKIPKDSPRGRGVIPHEEPLCQIRTVFLTLVVRSQLLSLWSNKSSKEVIEAAFCTEQLPAKPSGRMFCLSQNLTMTENIPVMRGLDATCA
ncbi:phospholipase A1 member A [Lissotriton helveticus]